MRGINQKLCAAAMAMALLCAGCGAMGSTTDRNDTRDTGSPSGYTAREDGSVRDNSTDSGAREDSAVRDSAAGSGVRSGDTATGKKTTGSYDRDGAVVRDDDSILEDAGDLAEDAAKGVQKTSRGVGEAVDDLVDDAKRTVGN